MIPQPPVGPKVPSAFITSPLALLALLEIAPEAIDWQWDPHFPLRVTPSFAARMEKGNPHDPLLRQVLSTSQESQLFSFIQEDPLAEREHNPVPGVLHKYASRVLLTLTQSCAVHCRFCFRRDFPYAENNPGQKGWSQAMDYIASDPRIIEVILSGGDPLMVKDHTLQTLITQLAAIPHVHYLRLHTRVPIMIPERITPALITLLSQSRFPVVMVYHINHPAEIIPSIAQGVAQLRAAGITVLNQTTLLAGVNDSPEILHALSLALFSAGILPYYVHLLDPVPGVQHFSLPLEKAKILQQALRATLPGYLVPRFVKEIAHQTSKIPLDAL